MKKIAIAIGMALSVSASTHAANGPTLNTATGTLEMTQGCEIALTLQTPEAKMNLADAKDGIRFTTVTATPTCEGQVWIHPDGERDGNGRGLMTSERGAVASYAIVSVAGSTIDQKDADGRYDVLSNGALPAGGNAVASVQLTNGWKGLPTTADKYVYKIATGFVTE